jgi:hypothetical protein
MEHRWCFTAFERPPGTLNECSRPQAGDHERQLSLTFARGWQSFALLLCHVVIAALFHTGFEFEWISAGATNRSATRRPQRMRISVYCDFWSKVRFGRWIAGLTVVLRLLKSLR